MKDQTDSGATPVVVFCVASTSPRVSVIRPNELHEICLTTRPFGARHTQTFVWTTCPDEDVSGRRMSWRPGCSC